jgi:AraC family transcriptional regulator, melibiose operon regulatory protein
MRNPLTPQDRHEPAIGFSIWRMQAVSAMDTAHTHPDVEVNYLFEGGLAYLHGGSATRIEPGRFTVFWGGVPHQVLPPGITGDGIWVTVPLAWFLQWRLPNGLHDRVLGGEIVSAPPSAADRGLLERWLADSDSGDPGRRGVLQLEMEARFHRLALELPRRRTGPHPGADGTGRIARITRFIALHYREPISVADVARGAGLHPKYLMRVFKKQCGVGVWEYLTRLRVSHAQRLLITTDAKVLDVAMESGFSSAAPFYAAFAARTGGIRPLAYRRRYRFSEDQTR